MSADRRITFFVSLIFVSGLLVGGTLMNLAEHYWLHAHPREEYDIRQHRRIASEMRSRLHLTQAQQQQLDQILQQTVRDYQAVQNDVEPRYDQVRAEGRARLRAILNPAQRSAFDAIVARVDREYPRDQRPASIPTPCPVGIDTSHR